MHKKKKVKILTTTATFTAIVLFSIMFLNSKEDIKDIFRSMDYEVEVKEVSFQGYDFEKIFAKNDKEKIFLSIVKNVEEDSHREILEKLNNEIYKSQTNFTVFDPYMGEERSLHVPEEIKPIKKETKDEYIYYIVYVNKIFSLMVFFEEETVYKGLYSTYYCKNESNVYRLEVYFNVPDFDEERALNILSLSSCR